MSELDAIALIRSAAAIVRGAGKPADGYCWAVMRHQLLDTVEAELVGPVVRFGRWAIVHDELKPQFRRVVEVSTGLKLFRGCFTSKRALRIAMLLSEHDDVWRKYRRRPTRENAKALVKLARGA